LVVDKATNEPITGASISVVGTSAKDIVTDHRGQFSLTAPANGLLRVSFLGYATQNVAIRNQTKLTVVLEESATEMDEVVVTALGITREARSLSYAQQSVNVNSMTEARGSSLMDMLSGKAA